MSHDPNCLFCKIVEGKIPSRKVYEDDDILAFHDIHPWAPVHFLMIPKRHVPSLAHVTEEDAPLLGKMLALAPKLALQEGCRPYPSRRPSAWSSTPAPKAGRKSTTCTST
jgi:histidine triad (HIT) family protein